MEQLYEGKYQIETSDQNEPVDRDKYTAEASDIETKERENPRTIARRENIGKGVEHVEIKFGGNKYCTQFIHVE